MKQRTILSNKDVKLNPDDTDDFKYLKKIEGKIADILMNDFRYKTGFKNAIRKKGLNDRQILGKLSDDRFGEM